MFFLLFCLFAPSVAVLVQTPFGEIKGFSHETDSGSTVNVFLGVRYAQEPTGKRRFEKPVMVEPWSDTLDATEFGPVCYPHHKSFVQNNTSEDCLSANFIVPAKQNDNDKLPVFVFVHGGGYVLGEARSHGYKAIAENFGSKGIITVTIQYRLGFLGFFSNGNKSLPGNLGLWDQTVALKFIRDIIPSLGGDVNRITVGGLSAGSASVTQLLASPHSNNLFSQAIQLSGSGLADWAYSEKVVTDSLKLSSQVGCAEKDVKKCLQEKTMEELLEATTVTGSSRKHLSFFQFHPRFDGDFFPEDMDSLFKKAPKKKTMQGVTNQENFLFTAVINVGFNVLYVDEQKRHTFGLNSIEDLLEMTFGKDEFGAEAETLTSWALMSYGDVAEHHNSTFYLLRYTDFGSDLMFNIPIHQEIEFKTQNGWDTYYFVTDYITDSVKDATGLQRGATHGAEIRYLMDMFSFVAPIPFTEQDNRFQNVCLTSIVNFIKSGSPSTENVKWQPTTVENPGRHLRMNHEAEMTDEVFRGAATKLWLDQMPQRFGVETARKILPGIPRRQIEREEL